MAGDVKRHGFNPWVGKISWRRAWQPTPVFLSGESLGQRSLVNYRPQLQRVRHDRSNVARTHASTMASKDQGFMFDYNFHLSFKFPHSDHSLGFTVLCQFRSFKVSSRKPSRRVEGESGAFKNITAIRKIRRTWLCLNRKESQGSPRILSVGR